MRRHVLRSLAWCVWAAVALQLVWLGQILAWRWTDPMGTAMSRSEHTRLLSSPLPWRHEWVDMAQISPHLQRAVLAAEDSGFVDHHGIEWEAMQAAWATNEKRKHRTAPGRRVRLVGGSTITQQLAKNLWLSGERHLARKGQELVLALAMDAVLPKTRILELYLNHVEWGEGIFGAQAAALHYFRKPAKALSAQEAAQLAVMLPAPKRYQKNPQSAYLRQRMATVLARMPAVALPR